MPPPRIRFERQLVENIASSLVIGVRLRIIKRKDQKHITEQILWVQISAGKSSAKKREPKNQKQSILTTASQAMAPVDLIG